MPSPLFTLVWLHVFFWSLYSNLFPTSESYICYSIWHTSPLQLIHSLSPRSQLKCQFFRGTFPIPLIWSTFISLLLPLPPIIHNSVSSLAFFNGTCHIHIILLIYLFALLSWVLMEASMWYKNLHTLCPVLSLQAFALDLLFSSLPALFFPDF